MKATEEESARLKTALKHLPCTPGLIAEAEAFPEEAGEAIDEVEKGTDTAAPDSWVARYLADDPAIRLMPVFPDDDEPRVEPCAFCGNPATHSQQVQVEVEGTLDWSRGWIFLCPPHIP